MLLDWLLTRLVRVGTLTLVDAEGRTRVYRGEPGPEVRVRLHDKALHWRLPLNVQLTAGEAYMDGTLTVEDGSVFDLLNLAAINLPSLERHPFFALGNLLQRALRRLHQFNILPRAQANVAHHYDISGAIYDLFLDADRQYSCAYFVRPDDDLETAQENKKNHIAAKLLLREGQKVLDIGCGWGGLALTLARRAKVEVTGMTLSTEQFHLAGQRAEEAGLAKRVHFHLRDYRHQQGRFDRIVSVGMFEHVGVGYYKTFFGKIHDLLTDDGVALIHTIGRADGPGATSPWIRKYIFPGGYIPALSEVTAAIERSRLFITDVEVLRLHYAETLRHWRERFVANWDEAKTIYDERFCRMWEFYLAASEVAFRHLGLVVFQVQLARRQDAVPLTRTYLTDESRRMERQPGAGRQVAA
ncbi:cyclopropane-fatty-acyl-phospholipid synthase family protein [Shumkonia mesophila]|uniref:cyclopropane-fatty-acyl-phospholipid synthase family protein n=1 Tax=Shumkonia mesophila TaxID=2838854 RepID=UPI0029345FD7|nr:cyclopropane-fatty-acyl-phospholipid synthase family protein [Shumkonia mesophila]